MAENYDRNRDNERSGNDNRSSSRGERGGYRGDRNDDRGGYRGGSSNRSGGSSEGGRGGYQNRNSDDSRGGQRRDDRGGRNFSGGDSRRDDRGGYRGSRDDRGAQGGRSFDRDNDRRDDRRGGDSRSGAGRDDNRGGYRGDSRGDDHGAQGGRGGYGGERRYEKRDDRDTRGGGRPGGPSRGHSNRAGAGREEKRDALHPQRSGFREERINTRINEPDLPGDLDIHDLDPLVLQDLKVLSRDNAEGVAKHMIMAATWLADDPKLALRHARAAKDRAGRISVVRETCGIAAYHAGEWKEALSELRAARRMAGGPGLIAVMADCERGLGRPEKAIDLARTEDLTELDEDSKIELAIVVAGARHDLGQHDSAVIELQRVNPSLKSTGLTASRLSYAYADALVLAGRSDEAREWFQHSADLDVDGFLDAQERLEQLDEGSN